MFQKQSNAPKWQYCEVVPTIEDEGAVAMQLLFGGGSRPVLTFSKSDFGEPTVNILKTVVVQALAELGKEGWEVIIMDKVKAGNEELRTFILKRPM